MVNSSWIFYSQLYLTHFSSCIFFLTNYCHLLSFLKQSQNRNVTNFCIISNLFHHKYNDKKFVKGNKKPDSLRNQFLCKTSFHCKTSFPCETSFPCKTSFPCETSFPCKTSFPAEPVPVLNKY